MTKDNTISVSVYADHWATISKGKIVQIADGFPPQELKPCQISLTSQEHKLLQAVREFDPEEIIKLAEQIKAKVIANGN